MPWQRAAKVTRLVHIARVVETHRKLLTTVAVLLAGQLLAYAAAQLVLENDLKALAVIAMRLGARRAPFS